MGSVSGIAGLCRKIALAFVLAACLTSFASAQLQVQLSLADGISNGTVEGRILLLMAPAGVDPLNDIDVTSSPDLFFGKNVFKYDSKRPVVLSGGGDGNVRTAVYGWPNVSLSDVAPGEYSVQAFLTPYEKVKRSDGSVVDVHFPCGDGSPNVNGVGSFTTPVTNVTVQGGPQTIGIAFNNVTAVADFTGTEIGGCSQGNYEDLPNLKYVKIRSKALSKFWKRDMYVGANVVLPSGYQANDTSTRYPVIYSQGHWPGSSGAFNYPDAKFSKAWDAGVIPATNTTAERPAPKLILVTFRHETPFYDDSYAVNTANIGPYGDAINDELIPYLESKFNIIAEPYARVQEGGSTGGWESAASLIYRPDLFGVCFSSYPDSLDFHRHQDIPLYDSKSAYVRDNGSAIPSIRDFDGEEQIILATVAQENHWELTSGTNSRSQLQWDVWNTVFGAQGINSYPLEPWNKVTGEIYPEAVEYWKHFDLSNYITSNWDNERNLGKVLKNRVFIYVGTHDDYFLNEGVIEFEKRVNAKGGPNWANVTILAGQPHGGNYQRREIWNYLDFLDQYIKDHAPDGKTPLLSDVTQVSSRGNTFAEVQKFGGRQVALARQAPPAIKAVGYGGGFEGTVGRWDPGVELEAQWVVNGKAACEPFKVTKGQVLQYQPQGGKRSFVQLEVTGRKSGLVNETRKSKKLPISQ